MIVIPTHERIARFERWLAQMRQTARPREFEAAAGGCRLETERMQAEVLDYLLRPTAVGPEPQAGYHYQTSGSDMYDMVTDACGN